MELLADIFGILVILVLLISVSLQKIKNDKTASRFSILAFVVLGFLITDFFCNLIEGNPELTVLSYIINVAAFLLVDGVIIAFSAYLATLIGRVSKKWEKIMNPGVVITYVRMVVVIVLAATGNLFIIDEDGMYIEQDLSIIVYIMLALVLVCLISVVIKNRACLSKKQLFAILVYLILPIAGLVLEFLMQIYIFTGMSLTIAVLIIYAVIQSEIIEGCRIRENVLEEISSTDLLTHLNNRRAYYSRFAVLEPDDEIGVLFCDINGLKYVNDNFGHAEGDKLIVRFAELLIGVFDEKDVFRISGDEFVVLVSGINRDIFDSKAENMRNILSENDSIASIGSSYGTGGSVEQLVSVAESIMYDNKREYYERNGIKHR